MNSKYSISRDVLPDNKRLLTEVNKLNMSASDVELMYARKKVKKLYDKTVSIETVIDTVYTAVYKRLKHSAIVCEFENTFLIPALYNTYLKIRKNTINYFSENPFVDSFYAALLSFFKSSYYDRWYKYVSKHIVRDIKKFKYLIEDPNPCERSIKFDFSKLINVKIEDPIEITINDYNDMITCTPFRKIDLDFIIVHSMVKLIKSGVVSNINYAKHFPYIDTITIEFYNSMRQDHNGFFMRNSQSLTEYYGKFKNFTKQLPEKLINDVISTIIPKTSDTQELQDSLSYEYNLIAPIFTAKGLMESMNRPSNNPLADMTASVEECEHLFSGLSYMNPENPNIENPKYFWNIYKLIKDFRHKYFDLGFHDEDLVNFVVNEFVNWTSSYNIGINDEIVYEKELRSSFIGRSLNHNNLVEKYKDHHMEMVKDVDTLLGSLQKVFLEYVDHINKILLIFNDWENTIINKIKTYTNYDLEDSINEEFLKEYSGFSVKVYSPEYLSILLKKE